MASPRLKLTSAADAVPRWTAPKTLTLAAVRSSALLGHDLINRFRAERFQVFLAGMFAMWFGAGMLVPLWEYHYVAPAPGFLISAAISSVACVGLIIAFRLAKQERYQDSITVVCIASWIAVPLSVALSPPVLPVLILMALLPVTFAEPYVRWQRGLTFVLITGVCILVTALLARFAPLTEAATSPPFWVATSFIVAGLTITGMNLMVIVWNNAAALRTSEAFLAQRAVELAASRTRITTAADEERRRIERDLHDGAQQHLVALSVLIQLARNAEPERAAGLLTEASDLVGEAIVEIRRLAHGIYPPLLVSGGLADALPALAAHSAVPVQVNIQALGRYPSATEAAMYYCCSEALQNAAKHGGPDTTVTLTVDVQHDQLTLVVEDDGPGFEGESAGRGLTNMADRLSALGGQLDIDSEPHRGTRITATVAVDG